ncbi:MAG: ATP-binding protein [Solobacterium sp.]|nr:ATP-binding protein [Solobacterium sp.]
MDRKFLQTIGDWQRKKIKEPLMIIGARQVGKTWCIREFCRKNMPDYVYINLEERPDIASVFEGNLEPEGLLRQISQILGKRITEDIPLILDEIQVSERAITSLKYFCESERNYRIICAGSLLGVKLKRFSSSFPVGKVRIEHMYPMDFEEFLYACGEELLAEGIRDAYNQKSPLAEGIHEKALQLYHDYLLVGGMPAAVQSYLDSGKMISGMDSLFYKNLTLAYLADMTKYVTSPAEGVKITEVYNSIPRQLSRENPKFKYKEVRPRANKRDFSGPLDWLNASGMIHSVHKLDAVMSPMKSYEDVDSFKVYLSDVGLLSNMSGLQYKDLLSSSDNVFKGAVIENYVVQQLIAAGMNLYYFKPSDSMEIDLVFNLGGQIVPAEIKSGRHKRSRSLLNYIDEYHPERTIRFSERNFGLTGGIESVPLYAVWCLGERRF